MKPCANCYILRPEGHEGECEPKPFPMVGDRVAYYTGGLFGTVTKVVASGVHVKWDNGAPDLGPYPLGRPTSSVRLV